MTFLSSDKPYISVKYDIEYVVLDKDGIWATKDTYTTRARGVTDDENLIGIIHSTVNVRDRDGTIAGEEIPHERIRLLRVDVTRERYGDRSLPYT